VYEDGPTSSSYFNRKRGEQDGLHAHQYARALGQPPGTTIYFAVDYDAPVLDTEGVITEYFAGVSAALMANSQDHIVYQVGVYGSGRVCAHIKDMLALAKYSWLAESHGWAGHAAYTKPDIRQEVSSSNLCSLEGGAAGGYEDNFATGDFGSFSKLESIVFPQIAAPPAATSLADTVSSSYALKLKALAASQYDQFHLYSETESPLKEQIRHFWEDLAMTFPGVQTAWSAVFVSWLMRQAGASPAEFKASSAHSRFVYWAIKNQENNAGMFRAHPLNEYAPKVGDIVQNNRGGQILTFAFAAAHEAYESHSAVVVECGSDAKGAYIITIGGNESNTVGRKRIAVDKFGHIIQREVDPYICVIQNLK
jgi:hypothetical protein